MSRKDEMAVLRHQLIRNPMKKVLLICPIMAILTALVADEPVSKLNGAFRQTKNKFGSMTTWKTRDSITVINTNSDFLCCI